MKNFIGKKNALLLELPLVALGLLLQSAKIAMLYATELGQGYTSIWHYDSTPGLICMLFALLVALIATIDSSENN